MGLGDKIADGEGEGLAVAEADGLGLGEGLGLGVAEAEGDELGLTDGFGVALIACLTEGFADGLGDGEGEGLGSGVGLGEGELVSPKTSGLDGKKTDLNQNPEPKSITRRKADKESVSRDGLPLNI